MNLEQLAILQPNDKSGQRARSVLLDLLHDVRTLCPDFVGRLAERLNQNLHTEEDSRLKVYRAARLLILEASRRWAASAPESEYYLYILRLRWVNHIDCYPLRPTIQLLAIWEQTNRRFSQRCGRGFEIRGVIQATQCGRWPEADR